MRKLIRSTICIPILICGCALGTVTEQERWEFVQQKFIDEPEMAPGGWVYRYFKYIAPGLAMAPGGLGLWYSWKGLDNIRYKISFGVSGVLTAALPIAAVCWLWYWRMRENFDAFRNYVIYWDEYKEYTPEIFHEAFDGIFKKYQEHSEPEKYLKEVAWPLTDEIIKICIEHFK